MKVVNLSDKIIKGIKIKTNNILEMSKQGRIPKLWSDFQSIIQSSEIQDSIPYGVYYNYTDVTNPTYSLIAGIESQLELPSEFSEEVQIKAGFYLEFSKAGELPQAVIELWQEIWQYFESTSKFKRLYTTDYEVYATKNLVKIYIAIEENTL